MEQNYVKKQQTEINTKKKKNNNNNNNATKYPYRAILSVLIASR